MELAPQTFISNTKIEDLPPSIGKYKIYERYFYEQHI